MGFKCPFCKTDFGHDKEAFDIHMKDENKPLSKEPNGKTDMEAEEIHEKHVQFVIENFNLVYGGKQ